MDLIICGPAVDEEANGDQGRGVDHGRQTVLGLHLAGGAVGVGFRFGFEDAVGGDADYGEAEHGAYAKAEIGEAHGAGREAVLALEDAGEGCEEQVQVAVNETDVDRHGEHDGREEEHLCWPDDAAPEEVSRAEARVELGAEIGIACLFTKSFGFSFEEGDGVGFAHEDERQGREESGDHR